MALAPTAAAVKDGSYAIARPFNIVTKGDSPQPAADFLAFIMSAEGQAVVSDNKYIAIDDAPPPSLPMAPVGRWLWPDPPRSRRSWRSWPRPSSRLIPR